MASKPTGVSGFFRAELKPDGTVTGGFEQLPFSSEKQKIEVAIASAFIFSMNRDLGSTGERFIMDNPKPNSENHFDLTVSTFRGDAYLELCEIQPGIPYGQIKSYYYSYEFAREVRSAVHVEQSHYAHSGRGLFLLLYTTHWALSINDVALMCLRYWLARDRLVFDAVFTYEPFDVKEGIGQWAYPFPPQQLGSFDPELVRDHWCLNVDPRGFSVQSAGK